MAQGDLIQRGKLRGHLAVEIGPGDGPAVDFSHDFSFRPEQSGARPEGISAGGGEVFFLGIHGVAFVEQEPAEKGQGQAGGDEKNAAEGDADESLIESDRSLGHADLQRTTQNGIPERIAGESRERHSIEAAPGSQGGGP